MEKCRKRFCKWREKTLSFGGRVMLINFVISSLPFFYLSFSKILVGVARKTTRLQREFLWRGEDGVRKLTWVKWDVVCRSREQGCLGVENIELFNKTLSGKSR